MKELLVIPTIAGVPVSLNHDADTKKSEVLKLASAVTQVKSGKELQASVNNRKALKELIKEAEACCEVEKAPFYSTYKKILAMTAEYILALETEDRRLKKLNDDYAAEEDARVQKENQRIEAERVAAEKKVQDAIAEQERLAAQEQERIRLENQRIENDRLTAQKKADDAAKEVERLKILPRPSAAKIEAAQKAVEVAQAAVETVQSVQPLLSAVTIQQEIAAENRVETAIQELKVVQTTAPTAMTRAAGMRVRKVVKFEITNPAALYAVRPEWFNLVPKTQMINQSITKDTVLPGLRCFESIET